MADPATAPLSFQQEQLWLVEQAPNARGLYNELSALRLTGELDLSALERSVDLLVQRHESLRTVFPSTEGGPVQLIGCCAGRCAG
jgi:nonribosomal peptide synthetase DhbF